MDNHDNHDNTWTIILIHEQHGLIYGQFFFNKKKKKITIIFKLFTH